MKNERIHIDNILDIDPSGEYVIYRMQASIRLKCNFSYEYAAKEANRLNLPLIVLFIIEPYEDDLNLRHITFLLDGLKDIELKSRKKGFKFVVEVGLFSELIESWAERAALIVSDCGYSRYQRSLRNQTNEIAKVRCVTVEDNVIVPVEIVSNKQEWAARTIRPKIHRYVETYLTDAMSCRVLSVSNVSSSDGKHNEKSYKEIIRIVKKNDPLPPTQWKGGEDQAGLQLKRFVKEKLSRYENDRNDPSLFATSRLSPYLHYGFISPLVVYRVCQEFEGTDSFLEQLLVRRELSINYIYYNHEYDQFASLPDWCKRTLREHEVDKRNQIYTLEELEACSSDDIYWNAAMTQMIVEGFMENTMRMYWGKKIIEWSKSPEYAFELILYLNNRYFIDGRDANSYVGVAWCFGLHDRPFKERKILGTVRPMTDKGLERKYNILGYVEALK